MNKRKISKLVGGIMLAILIFAPCISIAEELGYILPAGSKNVNELTTDISEYKNPSWNNEHEELDNNEFLFSKYLYYKGKFYDLRLDSYLADPTKLETCEKGMFLDNKINVTIFESGTSNKVCLDNFYFSIGNLDRQREISFKGDISNILFREKGECSVRYAILDDKTIVSGKTDEALDSGRIYVKFDESIKEELYLKVTSVDELAENLSIKFYIESTECKVVYKAKEDGKIGALSAESIKVNEYPTGGDNYIADEGKQLKCWTCDKPVMLSNGTFVASGDAITKEEVKKVLVQEDLTFTASFEPQIETSAEASAEASISESSDAASEATGAATETSSAASETSSAASELSGSGMSADSESASSTDSETASSTMGESNSSSGTDLTSEQTIESGTPISSLDSYNNEYDENSYYDGKDGKNINNGRNNKGNGEGRIVKTGDNKNIIVYSFVLLVSAILLRIVRKAM